MLASRLGRQSVQRGSMNRMVYLIGPGGAGKTTVGSVLAHLLGCPFLDLDRQFSARHGDIGQFIAAHGYQAYAHANVETYCAIASAEPEGVLALSSGFMTYPPTIHERYAEVRRDIARSPTTFVLLPSLNIDTCVAETVCRQLMRPFGRRDAAREEAVIRDRFGTYVSVPAPKIETMRPPPEVAAEIMARLPANLAKR
jgi:shikimate kinase